MSGEMPVETFRWKTATRHAFGGDVPVKGPEGSFRSIAEGGWLAVAFTQDGTFDAYVESLERAKVQRSLVAIGGGRSGPTYMVASLEVESAVGVFRWRSDLLDRYTPYRGGHAATSTDLSMNKPGELILPDGDRLRSAGGTGMFDVPGCVRAYKAWRNADVEGGWSVVSEVPRAVRDDWRPLLAALPMLLFTIPPTG